VTVILAGFAMMAEFNTVTSSESYLKYSTVVGYFLQDDPDTDPYKFDFISTNFGLIDRIYDTDSPLDNDNKTQWERFERKVRSLDSEAGKHTAYKVLFLGRHGEGYHNVAESFYGTELWDVCRPDLDFPHDVMLHECILKSLDGSVTGPF